MVAQTQKVLFLCNTPFTQGLWPLCLPCATTKPARSPLKAEGRPNCCLGRSRVAHRTFRHRRGRHGRREVLRTLCINLSDTPAFLVTPLCLLWLTNSVHWAITVATTVPPFSNHSNTWATMAMVLPSLCLLCATCCATTAALVVQGRHKGRAAAVTQKQNFLGSGDYWAS